MRPAWHDQAVLALLVAVAVALVLFGAAVALTRPDPVLALAPPDQADLALPAGELRAADINRIGFALAFRGYRMDEVDAVLLRLQQTLAAQEAELAQWAARAGLADRASGQAWEESAPWPNSS